jgi:hypothetical protein
MRTPVTTILGISALVPLVVSVLLIVFAWPVVNTAPNKLPIGLVTSTTMTQRLPKLLEGIRPGAFDLKAFSTENEARQAILEREVYGAIVLDPTKPEDFKVLTASAGSPAVAQLIGVIGGQVGTLLSASGFAAPILEDLVPATTDDPRQAGLVGGALPLVISGIISGLLLTTRLRNASERITATLLIALLTGFAVTSIVQFGFKTLEGSYLTNSLIASLAVAAVVSFEVGLGSSLGVAGLGLAAVTMMLVANPFSALSSAPEMLPGIWGPIGQLLPLGAFGHLLRSVAFFNGNGAGQPLWVLLSWVVFGLALILIGSRQTKQTAKRSLVTH